MAHAIWSGAINFGLVTIPVKLFTAVKTDDLSFNMLHKKDEGRIKYERVCSVDGEPVPWDEIVKGYEYEKGQYVLLTDEDFAKVNPEATQSVDIVEFVELDRINPMFFDKPYYLEPTKQGRHAYALLREALAGSNRVAIARVVIRTKEYIAAVKPLEDALVLELMHWANEIVPAATLDLPGGEKLPEKEMQMARMLIDTMSVNEFEPEIQQPIPRPAVDDDRGSRGRQGIAESKEGAGSLEGGQPDGRARAESRGEQEAPRGWRRKARG